MSLSRDVLIDLRSPLGGDHQAPAEGVDDRSSHLLRLALDLQLEALLITLAAAAAHDVHGHDDADPDWRRWLTEDLALARELTATALEMDAALPAVLGPAGQPATPRMAVDLLARYESMTALLDDLADRWEAGPGPEPAWAGQARAARSRCAARMRELRAWLQAEGDARSIRVGYPTPAHAGAVTPARDYARSSAVPDRSLSYLPGELLG